MENDKISRLTITGFIFMIIGIAAFCTGIEFVQWLGVAWAIAGAVMIIVDGMRR